MKRSWILLLAMIGLIGAAWGWQRRDPKPGPVSQPPGVRHARTDLLHYDTPLRRLLRQQSLRPGQISLLIEKSQYRLTLRHRGKAIKTYPVVFGLNPRDDKRYEGDRCTPEGRFTITSRQKSARWICFLGLSYPTATSRRNFRQAQREGKLPANATIGGNVGIHGTPHNADAMIDSRQNWTWGCISMKSTDVGEIYDAVRVGTPVTILH